VITVTSTLIKMYDVLKLKNHNPENGGYSMLNNFFMIISLWYIMVYIKPDEVISIQFSWMFLIASSLMLWKTIDNVRVDNLINSYK